MGRATDNDRKTIRRQLATLVTSGMARKETGKRSGHGSEGDRWTPHRKLRGANVKTSEPLDIDWTARPDIATGQPPDKQVFALVNTSGQLLDTANGRPLDTPAPL